MSGTYRSIFRALLADRQSVKFSVGVIFGLAFSISVILCTIGIMDGFAQSLKSALRKSSGDLYFYARSSFFNGPKIKANLQEWGYAHPVMVVQSEGFLVADQQSRGVLIRGVSKESFFQLTGLELKQAPGQIVIGKQLALQFNLKVGDQVALMLAHTGDSPSGLPGVQRLAIAQIVEHGIYQKDLRLVYLDEQQARQLLGIGNEAVNWATLEIPPQQNLDEAKNQLQEKLGDDFIVRTYWYEFSSLLEAVQLEKWVIGLILQLIVVIACFNVVAFILFLNEKKSRELFLFRALGMSPQKMRGMWFILIVMLWFSSSVLSIGLTWIFNWALGHLPLFKLPGEIYNLERLQIILTYRDYALVFAGAAVWPMLVGALGLRRVSKGTVLPGLRKEFT